MNLEEQIKINIDDINEAGHKKKLMICSSDLAKLLGVSPSTIEKWRREAIGPGYKIVGGRIMYPKREIAIWMSETVKTA